MRSETERKIGNCFDRLELAVRGILAGPPLAKMLETLSDERKVALAALRENERRICGCLETVSMDESGRCLGCGKVLARGA